MTAANDILRPAHIGESVEGPEGYMDDSFTSFDYTNLILYTMLMAMFVRSAVRMLLWSHCSGDTTTVVRWLLWKGRHIRKSFPGCA